MKHHWSYPHEFLRHPKGRHYGSFACDGRCARDDQNLGDHSYRKVGGRGGLGFGLAGEKGEGGGEKYTDNTVISFQSSVSQCSLMEKNILVTRTQFFSTSTREVLS